MESEGVFLRAHRFLHLGYEETRLKVGLELNPGPPERLPDV
jgi:hypothetical protein